MPADSTDSLRVVFLTTSGALGGAERSLRSLITAVRAVEPRFVATVIVPADGALADALRSDGTAVVVVALPRTISVLGDSPTNQAHAGLQVARVLRALPALVKYGLRLRTAVRVQSPHIVHSNGLKMHVLSRWISPRGVPVVWHLRDYLADRRVTRRVLRLHATRKVTTLAISESIACDARRHVPRSTVVLVPNRIDGDEFKPEGPKLDLDALSGLPPPPPGTLRIGLVATFARWKGHDVFLRALAQIDTNHSWRAYVIGGPISQTLGSDRSPAELDGLVAQLDLQGRVGFTGFVVEDVASVMRSLDVVVHASTRPEPFGRTIIEAQACGRAVIVAARPDSGAVELVTNEVDGLLHTAGDAVDLARCLRRCVDDPSLRARLGSAGRGRALERAPIAKLGGDVAAVYAGLPTRRSKVDGFVPPLKRNQGPNLPSGHSGTAP